MPQQPNSRTSIQPGTLSFSIPRVAVTSASGYSGSAAHRRVLVRGKAAVQINRLADTGNTPAEDRLYKVSNERSTPDVKYQTDEHTWDEVQPPAPATLPSGL
jgi:DUF971 family protein